MATTLNAMTTLRLKLIGRIRDYCMNLAQVIGMQINPNIMEKMIAQAPYSLMRSAFS